MSIYLGRKKSMVLLYLVCAASILLLMTLQLLIPDAPVVMTEFFSLCGKVASTAAFSLIWYYTAELSPTQYRSIILGMASMCSVFGSVSSPYINDLLGEVKVWSPSALFGSVSLLSTGLAFFLPETVDIELPESVDYFAKKPKTPSDNSTEGNTLPSES
ncbi:solute carrier family 22 member 5-like [Homarus americanus]|uniref:solute carrier family 22 member 5-like n=1 Tax=Homarus americanus TaxID=6706 RepID=UPI001C495A8D|nr:solute carrier family 22 member 5-like [Homarus americanus]